MEITIVERAKLVVELLVDIPLDCLHTSKKVNKVDRMADGSILLHFTDGTSHECDILIGADGIHSTVRKIVLGSDDPAAMPRNTGTWCIMTLNSYEKAESSLGCMTLDPEDARTYAWIGDGSFMMHNILNSGSTVQFTIAVQDDKAIGSDSWQKTLSRENLRSLFIGKGWQTHLEAAVTEVSPY